MKKHWKSLFVVTLVLVFALTSLAAFSAQTVREETVIYTGISWAPPNNWNPLYHNPQTGTVGLMYDPLFHFNPHTGEWIPFLAAEEGEWIEDDVFYVKLREEAKWHDGVALTANDVVFTYQIANEVNLFYSSIWNYLGDVVAISETEVEFHFDRPNYQQWQTYLYAQPIVPEHIFSEIPKGDLANITNEDAIGSGPYTIGEAREDRMIWERVDDWWGNDVHGQPGPRYVEDVLVFGNNIALGMLLQRELDVSNNFLPGTPAIVATPEYAVTTYFDEAPYHLSGNTGLLYLNTRKPGLDDPVFRRALAFAVNSEEIINRTYQGAALPACPSGLFGAWAEYRSEEAVQEHGFNFDPGYAKQILDEAGYVDSNDDGWRNSPEGEDLSFTLQVPAGWSDWENIISIAAENFRAIGVNAEANFVDQTIYNDQMWGGEFDIVFNDYATQISGTPYTYFEAVAYHGIDSDEVTQGNFGRYDNQELFDLISDFNMVPADSDDAYEIAAEIQAIIMQDMPVIPVMLNPTYSQALETYWTNWPSADNPNGIAVGWGGLWQMGGTQTLLNLEPVQ
ncbi:ABC transporter substrate-binding protein [Natronospora cellulosivora (SeqCode)]